MMGGGLVSRWEERRVCSSLDISLSTLDGEGETERMGQDQCSIIFHPSLAKERKKNSAPSTTPKPDRPSATNQAQRMP
jgi:hypothetical protein